MIFSIIDENTNEEINAYDLTEIGHLFECFADYDVEKGIVNFKDMTITIKPNN